MTVRRVRTRIEGAAEMERVLRKLPRAVRGKVLTSAARAGAQVVRKRALANLGGDKGDIIVRKVRSAKASVLIRVGPPRKKFELVFREFGTAVHAIVAKRGSGSAVLADAPDGAVFGPSIDHPGQAPRPFLRPAYDETKRQALDAMGKSLGRGIERAAKKLAGPFAKSGLGAKRRRRRRR